MNVTNEFMEKAMKSATIKPVLGAIAMVVVIDHRLYSNDR
jgi:hypothetical protein